MRSDEEKMCTVGISPEGICKYACVGEAPMKDIKSMLKDGYTITHKSVVWCRENLFQKVQ